VPSILPAAAAATAAAAAAAGAAAAERALSRYPLQPAKHLVYNSLNSWPGGWAVSHECTCSSTDNPRQLLRKRCNGQQQLLGWHAAVWLCCCCCLEASDVQATLLWQELVLLLRLQCRSAA
jgi:hypothetical protein